MRNASSFLTLPLLCLALACGSAADPSPNDGTSEDALEADSALDPVYIANAKAFFEPLVTEFKHRDTARIPYSALPEKLAKEVEQNNPDPKAEWAAEAYRTKVKNARGHAVVVFGVMDGIDDEGESITLYTSTGRDFAEGDDYRGFRWTK
jgi:hypothetical protein